jgi:hypothetical protein
MYDGGHQRSVPRVGLRPMRYLQLLLSALLVTHAGLLFYSASVTFPTRNEVAHIPAGLSYWQSGTFSLYSVNPPLWKLIATIPALTLTPDIQGLAVDTIPAARPEWEAATHFLNRNSGGYFLIVWSARIMGIVWSTLAGWIVYRWASQLYGPPAGLLGLTLWCFGPYPLGHAPIVTPDIPATASGLIATYAFWRYLRSGSWGTALVSALLLGVAQLTKFTLLVLYPTWLVLVLVHAQDRANTPFRAVPLRTKLSQGAAIALLSIFVLNLGYLFDGTGQSLGDYQFVSQAFRGGPDTDDQQSGAIESGNRFRGSWLGLLPVPLPGDYVLGIDLQKRDFESRWPSYLRGDWRDRGWWYYCFRSQNLQ